MMETPVWSLSPDEPVVHICWSREQEARYGDGAPAPIHLCGHEVGKSDGVTACGVSTLGYWDFDVENGTLGGWDGCGRCAAVARKYARERGDGDGLAGSVPPVGGRPGGAAAGSAG